MNLWVNLVEAQNRLQFVWLKEYMIASATLNKLKSRYGCAAANANLDKVTAWGNFDTAVRPSAFPSSYHSFPNLVKCRSPLLVQIDSINNF